jgi:NH3-dependent NAD+ synthetase
VSTNPRLIKDEPMQPMLPALPRQIDPKQSFDALVESIYQEQIIGRGAPGMVVGISGTDSILAFMACAKAYEKAGKPDRVVGIHYGESMPEGEALAKRLEHDPQAFWFQREIMPWLKEQAPQAQVIVDSSIDYRKDGQRWGALLDWSVTVDPETGRQRPRDDSYWVVGTRNASEEMLMNYSNVSNAASIQPIIQLWKSEVLNICNSLGVPKKAIQKSCETDCVCGRFELPALNIENVDALLMVRKGELSPRYVEENIAPELRKELEHFIERQINDAGFKQQIPYLPKASTIVASQDIDPQVFAEAKQAAQTGDDIKPLSKLVPDIIRHGHANAACDLVCTHSSNREAWLPEAMTLLATPGLRLQQKRTMLKQMFDAEHLRIPDAVPLATHSIRLGNYGFAFPKWRFVAQQSGDNPALLEQFGMQRLTRDSDVRDASVPPSDPARDELGTGYRWNDKDWQVEYRRSYIVCSHMSEEAPATVVIRNNSHFFGRDRLKNAAYVSFEKLTPEQLDNMTADSLERSGQFRQWQDITRMQDELPLKEKFKRVDETLNYLDRFERNLNQWLCSKGPVVSNGVGPDHSAADETGGLPHLQQFLNDKAAKPAIKGRPALYVGEIEADGPPWFPDNATPLSRDMDIEQIASHSLESGKALALMSGSDGDYPVVSGAKERVQQGRNTSPGWQVE